MTSVNHQNPLCKPAPVLNEMYLHIFIYLLRPTVLHKLRQYRIFFFFICESYHIPQYIAIDINSPGESIRGDIMTSKYSDLQTYTEGHSIPRQTKCQTRGKQLCDLAPLPLRTKSSNWRHILLLWGCFHGDRLDVGNRASSDFFSTPKNTTSGKNLWRKYFQVADSQTHTSPQSSPTNLKPPAHDVRGEPSKNDKNWIYWK